MKSVHQYNGLGAPGVISREELVQVMHRAKKEEQFHIYHRLDQLLSAYPQARDFDIDLEDPAFEIVPQSELPYLEEAPEGETPEGLGKPVSPEEIYQMITDKIINMLEEPVTWEKEWGSLHDQKEGYLVAYNFDSRKAYRGINAFLLGSFAIYNPKLPLLKNPYYLTFNQIEARKGKLKKDSKAKRVVYFTKLYQYRQDDPKLEIGTYDLKKFTDFVLKHRHIITEIKEMTRKGKRSMENILARFIEKCTLPILKYYNVFNGADVEGIDFKLGSFDGTGYVPPEKGRKGREHEPIPVAEAIIESYPKPAPAMKHGGDRAFYREIDDLVQMPELAQFKYVQAYYTTFFHELVHSTGAGKRLDREKGRKFGDKQYAFEELIAELGASFLSAEAGMLHYTFRNSVAYIKSWRKNLLVQIKEDNRFFFRAASQAQRAVDYMLDRDKNNVPAYEKRMRTAAFKKKYKLVPPKKKPVTRPPKKKTSKTKKTTEKRAKKDKPAGKSPKAKKGLAVPMQVIAPILIEDTKTVLPAAPEPVPVPQTCTKPHPELPVKREEVQEKKEIKPQKGVLSSADLMNMEFESLPFTGQWYEFMQNPAKNMKLAIWGKPKNGKTAGAAQLANYLTRFGHILYIFADQGFNKSTKDIWQLAGLADNPKAFASDVRELDALEVLVKTGKYQFVFLDMINTFIHRSGIKYYEFEDRFIKAYPDISFVLVFEVTKSGDFKGDQGWTHLPDALITVDSYLMENQGRYGTGHYVVWKEGLKKFNPKKYKEIYGEEYPQPVTPANEPIFI